MDETWYVGEKHKSQTLSQNAHDKVNPKNKNYGEVFKGACSICDRNKS